MYLTIGRSGQVEHAEIHLGQTPQLDEYALRAVRYYRFSPATRAGVPVAVRIAFAFDPTVHRIEATELEASAQPAPPRGTEASTTAVHVDTALEVDGDLVQNGRHEAELEKDSQGELDGGVDQEAPLGEVVVTGRSIGRNRERSAESVSVIELEDTRAQGADMAQILRRSTQVQVQQLGGLGSRTQLSMGGLGGDRLPVFIDGLPLAYTGFAFGLANVPVNLAERVELYQGVVPVRFASDALTGAVNLVTGQSLRRSSLSASYQIGSFETHRLTADGAHYSNRHRAFVRLTTYADTTANNYPVDVRVNAPDGDRPEKSLRRFHDGYRGLGARAAFGLLDRSWAERLVVTGYVSGFEKEIQNSATMGVVYGEVNLDKTTWGGNLTYRSPSTSGTRSEVVLGHNRTTTTFRDVSSCRYDWYGECFIELPVRGEIQQQPLDRVVHDDSIYLRADLSLRLNHEHKLNLVTFPRWEQRNGDDAEISRDQYDTLNTPQSLLKNVSAASWEADLFAGTLSNVAFVKIYQQLASTEEKLGSGEVVATQDLTTAVGAGDSARLLLTDDLFMKSSYEYATRLPALEEVFGDGALTISNLSLRPERSHNVNLGLGFDGRKDDWGDLTLTAQGSYRSARELITKMTDVNYFQYKNVGRAGGFSVSGQIGATEYHDRAELRLSASYQDLRNRSKTGDLAMFFGDRIVNQPYLNASGKLRISTHDLALSGDRLSIYWTTLYTHEFFLAWESAGATDSKHIVDSQLSHDASVVYSTNLNRVELTNAIEIANVTNRPLYDFYGVQRPGRSVFFKVTVVAPDLQKPINRQQDLRVCGVAHERRDGDRPGRPRGRRDLGYRKRPGRDSNG